jgi:death-on-curing protein
MVEYLTTSEINENIPYPIRDRGLLESALNRAKWDFDGENIFSKAGKIMTGIIFNHPYIDGNKRSSLEFSDAFLRKNKRRLGNTDANKELFEERLYDLVVGIASKKYDEKFVINFLEENSDNYDGNDLFGFGKEYWALIERLNRT